MSIWDDKDIKSGPDAWVKFDSVGDKVEGIVIDIARHTFVDEDTDEKKVVPKLTIRCVDGVERSLTAGQIRLKTWLVETRPEVGDWLKIELERIEPRGGKKKLKHFLTEHKSKDQVPVSASKVADDKPPF